MKITLMRMGTLPDGTTGYRITDDLTVGKLTHFNEGDTVANNRILRECCEHLRGLFDRSPTIQLATQTPSNEPSYLRADLVFRGLSLPVEPIEFEITD